MNIIDFIKKIQNREIDVIKNTEKAIYEIKKINSEYNYFNVISENFALDQAKVIEKRPHGRLAGLTVSIKDCICVDGVESTAGSKILKGYNPVFNAAVVEKIIREGAIIVGKTSQDEFGFGGFSINTGIDFKIPLNPFDRERSCGGSSGGSAGITQKASFPHISLGESTGGSIVNPASFCGIVGLCPTYGRVSRYGLIDYANSLDKIGPMAKNVYDAALMLEIISGFDPKESTTISKDVDKYTDAAGKDCGGMKIGIIKDSFGEGTDKGYYLIAMSESSTNLAKYCGMRYGKHEKLEGNFNEYFSKVRSLNFGPEAKRRIILGTFARMAGYRDAYYIKAMKVRTKIIEEYKKLFKKYDALISPTMPITAPKIKEIEKLTPLQNYMMDIMTVGPNLAGLPHMSIPVGFKGNMPVGMMLIGDHLEESKIIQLGSAVEK
ncbi:aspartyl/glutamyl-tRNA amidotransferase subunit A [Candidatus Woesearchaeota archaeon]|nr:aspartyl/glutamyl-tRNA amidotransferase subunit A [Candidatus Woesearchaeota archaeon]